jgi:hypothetical protein
MRFTGIRHTEIQGLPFTRCFLVATTSMGLHAVELPGWKDRSRPPGNDAMERRLAAILAADAVGDSRLMGQDETEDVDVTIKHGVGQRWSLMGPFETIDLDTPDCVSDCVERLRPAFPKPARQHSAAQPRDGALTHEIERQPRERLSAERLGERAACRDPRPMALLAREARADREHGG